MNDHHFRVLSDLFDGCTPDTQREVLAEARRRVARVPLAEVLTETERAETGTSINFEYCAKNWRRLSRDEQVHVLAEAVQRGVDFRPLSEVRSKDQPSKAARIEEVGRLAPGEDDADILKRTDPLARLGRGEAIQSPTFMCRNWTFFLDPSVQVDKDMIMRLINAGDLLPVLPDGSVSFDERDQQRALSAIGQMGSRWQDKSTIGKSLVQRVAEMQQRQQAQESADRYQQIADQQSAETETRRQAHLRSLQHGW